MKRSGPPTRKTELRASTPKPMTAEQRDAAYGRQRAAQDRAREKASATARSGRELVRPGTGDRPDKGSADKEPARKPAPRQTGPSQQTRWQCQHRDAGLCVRCGQPASDLDHRSGRGMGGRSATVSARINGPAWLLHLCGAGNTSGCHGWKETEREQAERDGFRLPRNRTGEIDAAAVPVRTVNGWARYLDDGTRVSVPAPTDDDARTCW